MLLHVGTHDKWRNAMIAMPVTKRSSFETDVIVLLNNAIYWCVITGKRGLLEMHVRLFNTKTTHVALFISPSTAFANTGTKSYHLVLRKKNKKSIKIWLAGRCWKFRFEGFLVDFQIWTFTITESSRHFKVGFSLTFAFCSQEKYQNKHGGVVIRKTMFCRWIYQRKT